MIEPQLSPLLVVRDLVKRFRLRQRALSRRRDEVVAVNRVSFALARSETLGIVGQSGSGKSTLARVVVGLLRADAGSVLFDGVDATTLRRAELRRSRARIQMVFQDPYSSLDPTKTIDKLVAEPLKLHTTLDQHARRHRVAELLESVGMPSSMAQRYPAELSGGQRQRVAIARAIALNPDLLIADEAVSALDVSTQAQVINLLARLRDGSRSSMLFVSHDLRLVRHISDRVGIMFRGRLVELGDAATVYRSPQHPYTQALLRVVPNLDPTRRHDWTATRPVEVEAPESGGCSYRPWCPHATALCAVSEPELRPLSVSPASSVACHLYEQTALEEKDALVTVSRVSEET